MMTANTLLTQRLSQNDHRGSDVQYKECPECCGEGQIETETAVADYQCGGYLRGVIVECHVCDGSGEVECDIFES